MAAGLGSFRFASAEETALAFGVSVPTVWRWCRLGRLRFERYGRDYYIYCDQLPVVVGPAA